MSEANREIARRYTAAIDERRVPEELLAPEFTIENVETAVTDRTYHGAEGVREWIEDFFGVLGEDARYESETIAAGEDFVVGDIRIVGKGSASGVPLDLHHYGVLWIRDGRITRAVGYPTRRDALRAVGVDQAMAEDNLEIVRRGFTAWSAGDATPMIQEMLDPDVVLYVEQAGQGVYRGHEGALQSLVDWTEYFDDFEVVPEEFLENGDHVVVRTRQTGSGKSSGARLEGRFWFVCQLREGKVVRVLVLNTEQAALEAAGLRR